ncbi:MAG TPA: sulfotransferase [Solirubrobacteraceae bacterium]|jgi:hypothetical protein|nr:sulfotransferase [Solirubrobacteraceae bacterium]
MAVRPDSPRAEGSSSPQKPKVIYVMGQGKSGSTILGVALGNCDGVFFAGELCTWLMNAGTPVLGGSERTRFWQEVRLKVEGASELFGGRAFNLLERSLSAIRVDRFPAQARLRGRYREVTEGLYRAIAERAQATHVVDTSHLPLRARELQDMDGIDLYLVFLVRNTESVVASYTRHVKTREVAERRWRFFVINVHLWVTYVLSVLVFLRQPQERRMLVHHEDFVANPEGVLRELLEFAGSSAELPDLSTLRTGIPLKANALVRSEVVALKAKAAAPHRSSRMMQMIQRPWTMILGRLRPVATGIRAPEPEGRGAS